MSVSNALGFAVDFDQGSEISNVTGQDMPLEAQVLYYIADLFDLKGQLPDIMEMDEARLKRQIENDLDDLSVMAMERGTAQQVYNYAKTIITSIGYLDEKLRVYKEYFGPDLPAGAEEYEDLVSQKLLDVASHLAPEDAQDAQLRVDYFYGVFQEIRAHVPEKTHQGSVNFREIDGPLAKKALQFRQDYQQYIIEKPVLSQFDMN